MGFIEAVKGIIEKFRAAGKSETEIAEFIERASEKATVKAVIHSTDDKRAHIRNPAMTVNHEANNWRRLHGLPMRRKARGAIKVWKRKENRRS